MKADIYLQKIKQEFPQVKWEKYRMITHGFDHVIIILDEKIVFRFPRSQEYKKNLSHEIKLLNYLGKNLSVGIPQYKYIVRDKSIAGYDMLHGCELKKKYFNQLSKADRALLAKQIGHFLSIIHTIPKDIAFAYEVKTMNAKRKYKKYVQLFSRDVFPKLQEDEKNSIRKFFKDFDKIANYPHPDVLLHNDLNENNMLWNQKARIINILDFSNVILGDPALDFRSLYQYGVHFLEEVLDCYTGDKDDKMLERILFYYKGRILSMMRNALLNKPVSFEEAYQQFRENFDL